MVVTEVRKIVSDDFGTLLYFSLENQPLRLSGGEEQRFMQILKTLAPEYFGASSKYGDFYWKEGPSPENSSSASHVYVTLRNGVGFESDVCLYKKHLTKAEARECVDGDIENRTHNQFTLKDLWCQGEPPQIRSAILRGRLHFTGSGDQYSDLKCNVSKRIYGHDLWSEYNQLINALARGNHNLFEENVNNSLDVTIGSWSCEVYNPTLERLALGAEYFRKLLTHVNSNVENILPIILAAKTAQDTKVLLLQTQLNNEREHTNALFVETVPPFPYARELDDLLF